MPPNDSPAVTIMVDVEVAERRYLWKAGLVSFDGPMANMCMASPTSRSTVLLTGWMAKLAPPAGIGLPKAAWGSSKGCA